MKSSEISGKSNATSVEFSDVDKLTEVYEPGMEVRSFVTCYEEKSKTKPKKLTSLQPLLSLREDEKNMFPENHGLTRFGSKGGGICEIWLGYGSADRIEQIWLPLEPS